MENNEEVKKDMEQGSAENEPKVDETQGDVKQEEKKEEKTYSRDELNKIINAEKQKALNEYKAQLKAEKDEADKLAKMDEDQKRSYELEQEKARANKAESELNAYRLKDETIRQASKRGISIEYLDTIDFSRETAESINAKLDIFEKTSKADIEKAISEYSKEPPPQTGDRNVEKDISELKTYAEIAEYYEKHPNAK